jgi:hypothetical protein
MSIEMDEEIKRWTARRKSALVLDIIQGNDHRERVVPSVRSSAFGDRVLDSPSQSRDGKRPEDQTGRLGFPEIPDTEIRCKDGLGGMGWVLEGLGFPRFPGHHP